MKRSALIVLAVICAAAALVASPARSVACAFDNETHDLSVDTLDHYYPGSYSVVLRMVEARRDGALTQLVDPRAPKLFSLQRLLRVVRSFEAQARTAARDANTEPPAVAILLVESMLWVRLPSSIADRAAEVHIPQPSPGDLVVVLGEDALAAIAAGKLDLLAAEQQGVLQLHGAAPAAAAFRRVYANVGRSAAPAAR